MGNKLDTTINNICEWVDKELINVNGSYESSTLPQTISALAELVRAKADIDLSSRYYKRGDSSNSSHLKNQSGEQA